MKDTKTTKLIKRRIKELNNASKHADDNHLKEISDEINFLKGRLRHYKNVAQKYHRKT
ncbi:hypothetical protein ACEN35_09770 [Leuconostoc mesenteroides]|uniref:hypothetical protein n=1 Tax=Leuconostoc mesenteroides TaxID=1245 RepID=UPI00388B17C0